MLLRSQDVPTRTARGPHLAALLLAALGALGAVQAEAQRVRWVGDVTLNSPANGDTYVQGETISATVTFDGYNGLAPNVQQRNVNDNRSCESVSVWQGGNHLKLQIQIGANTREARCPAQGLLQPVDGVDFIVFSYVVQRDDFDADGVSILADALQGGSLGGRGGNNDAERTLASSTRRTSDLQIRNSPNHKVAGSAAAITSTSPAALHENNLNSATVTVELIGTTFGSSVATSSFELVTTISGVTISGVASTSSGATSTTLTLSSTADLSAPADLAVKVLAAAHAGTLDLTSGTVPVAPVESLDAGPGQAATTIARSVDEGSSRFWNVELSTDPGAGCTAGVTITIASDNPAVTVSPATLTFTSATWTTGQVVTATAVEDGNLVDETVTVSHTVTSACPGTYPTTLAISSVTLTVDDNDTGIFSIDSPRVVEGDSGPTTMIFTVTLSPAASVQTTVDYAYAMSGSATSGTDHAAIPSGTLTFAPGETRKTISATVNGDTDMEPDEGIGLQLSNPAPSGFVLASGSGRLANGLIVDDDTPTFTIDAPRAAEPGSGTAELAFTVTLSPASADTVLVDWSDAGDGTATSGSDYAALAGGTLTFDPGETSKTVAVAVRADDADEADETVRVQIDNAVTTGDTVYIRGADGRVAAQAVGVGTITDYVPPPPDAGDEPPPPPANRAPEVVAALAATVLAPGGTATIELAGVFRDPEGEPLAYAAASANPEVASVSLSGTTLSIVAGRAGRTGVTVSATDPDGLTASAGFAVSVGSALSLVGDAEAPEGGTARLRVDLGVPRDVATAFRWRVLADTDPATADADAGDHGDAAGEGSIAAGERSAAIEVSILDDAAIEPAREWFAVAIEATDDDPPALARAQARVAVLEGVCDRTAAVAAALARGRDCTAPTPAELAATRSLALAGREIDTLQAEDLSALSGLRLLDLRGNALRALPAGLLSNAPALRGLLLGGNRFTGLAAEALASAPELRELDLSNNALAALAPRQFAGLAALRQLRLDGNALEALPDGLFAGVGNLGSLRLDGNPGAPFALRPVLERTDADPWAPGPATVRATLPTGAPFDLEVELSVGSVRVLAGATQSATSTVAAPAAGGAVRLDAAAPSVPETMCDGLPCWRGLVAMAGEPLLLFARAPRALPAPMPEALFGDALRLPLASLAAPGEPGGELTWSASSSDPAVAQARIADGVLLVEPVPGAEGTVFVEAVATDAHGLTATVRFAVEVEFHSPARIVGGWRGAVLQR